MMKYPKYTKTERAVLAVLYAAAIGAIYLAIYLIFKHVQ